MRIAIPVVMKEQGLKKGDKCVVAVMADNSNDKSYPPGKPQYTLDFAYHGGIYRDVWLINKKDVSITNVIEADRRDAGIFVHFSDISEKQAKVFVDVDLQNVSGKARKVKVEQSLLDASGKVLKTVSQNVLLAAGDAHQTVTRTSWKKSKPISKTFSAGRCRIATADRHFCPRAARYFITPWVPPRAACLQWRA